MFTFDIVLFTLELTNKGTLGPVSRKILSLEMDLSSLITMVIIVFSILKITRGLKIF